MAEQPMTTRPLNLIDDHRRLHLQQSEVEPTLVCVLLFVEDRPMAYAHADVQRCRFSMCSDGPLFWVGDTNFSIAEQERREIERFLNRIRRTAAMDEVKAMLADLRGEGETVTCARCGKEVAVADAEPEEGGEWECLPCWERCEAQERSER